MILRAHLGNLRHNSHVGSSAKDDGIQVFCKPGNSFYSLSGRLGLPFIDLAADQHDHRGITIQMQFRNGLFQV
jgi:hypothetical protein